MKCWFFCHDWNKWSLPVQAIVANPLLNIRMVRQFQVRTCQKCGKTEERSF
jgi:hypothetical protein